jgi:hypothetical protein
MKLFDQKIFGLAAALFCLAFTGLVHSEEFSPHDKIIIERNATLRTLSSQDPQLVRRILDAISTSEQQGTQPTERIDLGIGAKPAPIEKKRDADPDLENLERSSPEAAHDLFQLIKKAGGERKDKRP